MTVRGFYRRVDQNGEIKNSRDVKFENTGYKFDDGKVIWRKLGKDGSKLNIFAEQFNPELPWMVGKWFCKVDGGAVLREHPDLKVESERTASMSHEEYCAHLSANYYV